MAIRCISGTSLCFVSVLLGGVSSPALAQSADTPPVPSPTAQTAVSDGQKSNKPAVAGQSDQGLEEVVITAQHREQSAQDVGISLTTLSHEDLEQHDVKSVNDLAKLAPSFQAEPAFGSGVPQFRIRGMGFNDYASNNSPTVGIYVDQVAYPIPIMTQGLLFDIDRVEILRGPQGTLYGRNTTGGAVNILTADPTDKFSFGVTSEYNSLNDFKSEAYASGPVSDRFRIRLSGGTEQGGAWQKDRVTGQSLGDKDTGALRVKTDWDVNDDLNIKINAHYGRDASENVGAYLIKSYTTPSGRVIPADTDRTKTGWGISSSFASVTGLSQSTKPSRDNDTYGTNVTLEQSFGAIKFTNIASYEGLQRRELDDWDATLVNSANIFYKSEANVFSDEARLSSNQPGPLQWVTGLYYSREHLKDKFYDDFMDNYGFVSETAYKQNTQTISEFAQVDYALTDQIKLIGGVRNEREDRKLTDFSTKYATLNITSFAIPSESTGMSKVSGKAGLEYRVIQPVLLYATVSRGVKSGGFTAYNTLAPEQLTPFKPEKVLNYETGFKSDLIGRKLRLNGAVYYEDYKDEQVQSAVWNSTYGTIGKIVNAPKSELYGGELELDAEPTPNLHIGNGIGYSRGHYDQFTDLDAPASTNAGHAIYVDKSGRDLGFPKLTYNGSVSYTVHSPEYDITPQLDYSYRGQQRSNFGNAYDIAPYWIFDAGVTVRPTDGNWAVTLYGKNIFDKKYDVTRNYFVPQSSIGVLGEPASFGVRVKYTY